MLKDIYCIAEGEPRYNSEILEVSDELTEVIQQIDMILFTSKGSVLCMPEFGCDLEKYLFETSWNEQVIKNIIKTQIGNFIYPGNYDVDATVKFVQWDRNVAMVVDITIDGTKVASYLV